MPPTETLFVDDGLNNIEVARKMGFQTYQPKNKEDWRKAIDSLLLK